MPIISIPERFLDRTVETPTWIDVRVLSRNDRDICRELALLFPHRERALVRGGGEPHGAVMLIREQDGEDLRYLPDDVLGDDERVAFWWTVGC